MEPPVNQPANPWVGLNKGASRALVLSQFEIAGLSFRSTSSVTDAGEPYEPRQPKVA